MTPLNLTYVALHEVTWCMVVYVHGQNLHRDGSSFMWHQPCQRCKYTTSVDIQKTRHKKLVTHFCGRKAKRSVELHARALTQSARERRITLYIKKIKSNHHPRS